MKKISQKNIKFDNCQMVFNSILSNSDLTRNQIAENCDLSLMTVGKIVDFLISQNIVTEAKPQVNRAGRRAGTLNLNKQKFFLFFEIYDSVIYCTSYNLFLEKQSASQEKIKKNSDFEKVFSEYIADYALKLISDNLINDCFAVFVLNYFGDKQSLKSSFELLFPDSCIVSAETSDLVSALYNIKDDSYPMFCTVKDSAVHIVQTISLFGTKYEHRFNLGDILMSDGVTCDKMLKETKDEKNYSGLISVLLYNLTVIHNVTDIVIDVNSIYDREKILNLIKTSFVEICEKNNKICPSLSWNNYETLYSSGALSLIVNAWLKKNYEKI